MARLRAALLPMTMASGCAFAQRYGSSAASAAQKQPNPILSINTTPVKTWNYFQLSTLLTMRRTAVDVVDPKTNLTNVYEGVPLKELVSGTQHYQLEVYRDFWAFKGQARRAKFESQCAIRCDRSRHNQWKKTKDRSSVLLDSEE